MYKRKKQKNEQFIYTKEKAPLQSQSMISADCFVREFSIIYKF